MSQDPPTPKRKRNANAYLKYSGMVGQLLVLLFLAAYLGQWLDGKMENEKPLFTAVLLIVALVAYLFKITVDLNRDA